jgi:ribosomal protein S18 acetylase RimI-like enzyme
MMHIRPAASTDRQPLFNLIAKIDNFTAEEKELAREVVHDGLASASNGYQMIVAVDGEGSITGFICFGTIPITIDRWDVYWIAVDPRHSRLGIGSLLLQAMEKQLAPGSRIYVDTSSTNGYAKARAFYERHGYKVACLLPDFYQTGDDKVIYCKEL